jgi:glycosyltransferase involved in cell wall biosynthesis
MSLHIGLNAHLLSMGESYRGAGINRYIYNLLITLPVVDPNNRYTAFLGERRFSTNLALSLRFSRISTVRPEVRILWEQFVQPFALRKEEIDLLHSMAFVTPLVSPCPSVVTIYDLSFALFPEGLKRNKRLYLSLFTPISARRARLVIAISESTKRDIVRLFGITPEKVEVVYLGICENFRPLPEEEVEAFRKKRGLPERFILFVGTIEPRKNLTRLIEAFSLLSPLSPLPFPFSPLPLVIVGAKGWLYEEVFAKVEELGLEREVIFPGYIPWGELPLWYNAATIFVYPSLYEGFGLPPLEAMACGTPVIASNASSLPEVVGDAGILVSPGDVDGLAEAMKLLLSDETLREDLSRRGLRRAKGFSWEKTAEKTVQVYLRALHGGS